uniref:Uncharacterized protein n=1 Tax=Glossina palpalis gambiensis TaxID=67801 RepID=A0A1B0BR99_9MUSC
MLKSMGRKCTNQRNTFEDGMSNAALDSVTFRQYEVHLDHPMSPLPRCLKPKNDIKAKTQNRLKSERHIQNSCVVDIVRNTADLAICVNSTRVKRQSLSFKIRRSKPHLIRFSRIPRIPKKVWTFYSALTYRQEIIASLAVFMQRSNGVPNSLLHILTILRNQSNAFLMLATEITRTTFRIIPKNSFHWVIASLMATSGTLSVSNMSLNACFNCIWPQVMLEVITSIFLNIFAVGPLTAKKNANATIKDLPRELHNIATYVSNLAKVDLRLRLSPSPSSPSPSPSSPSPSSCVFVSSPDSFDISITASLVDSSKFQGTLIRGIISIREIRFVSESLTYGQADTYISMLMTAPVHQTLPSRSLSGKRLAHKND